MQDEHDPRDGSSKQMMVWTMLMLVSGLLLLPVFTNNAKPPAPQSASQETVSIPGTPGAAPATPAQSALPPAALQNDPEHDAVKLENESLSLELTRIGARLKRATVIAGANARHTQQLVPDWGDLPDAEAVYPLGLRYPPRYLGDSLDSVRWDVVSSGDAKSEARFAVTAEGVAKVEKSVRLTEKPYVAEITVSYTNISGQPQILGNDTGEPAFSLNWGPNLASGDKDKFTQPEVTWRKNGSVTRTLTSNLAWPAAGAAYSVSEPAVDWAAITSCYFVMAISPGYENGLAWATGDKDHFRLGVGAPRAEVAPNETITRTFSLYIGPRMGQTLAPAFEGKRLHAVLETFTVFGFTPLANFMNWFAILMLNFMNWCYGVVPNYGLAIIFLTIVVRAAVFPLTLKSMKSMKKMQKLAPEIEKIKAEVGEDQQELQRRTMELYREYQVNPLSGCLPILLQMPVFFAFYRMLANAFELRGAPFMLWMTDLSMPDYLLKFPFDINLLLFRLDGLNLLPILGGIAMVLSTKLTPQPATVQNQQQKMMMTIMPIFFSAVCYNMPAALNLYILVSTLLGIVQNYLVHVGDEDLKKKPQKSGSRPRHFYAAAQARKREAARDARREKRAIQPKSRPDANDETGPKKR